MDYHSRKWTIELMCSALQVSRSSYYAWVRDPQGVRGRKRAALEQKINIAFTEAKERHGSPRLAKDLQVAGTPVSRPTVARHMKRMGLRSKLARRFKKTTDSSHNHQIAPNVLDRCFTWDQPAKACVSDLTYIPTIEGFLYLTVVLDLFDRKPIGWSISEGMKASETVIPAILMAARNRTFKKEMIFHSDRGSQYACQATVNVIQSYEMTPSMSRKGNCWDNAVAESFFKSLKGELLSGTKLQTKSQTRLMLFEYLETWYNRKRRHSALENRTIEEFWKEYKLSNQSPISVA